MNTTANVLKESPTTHHALISWRSVIAGLLVTGFSLATLLSLGMALGGMGLEDGSSVRSAGLFTGIWFLVSTIISLAAGSYFAARLSKFATGKIGAAHGLVIAALVFGGLLYQTFSTLGWVGQAAGQFVGGTAAVATAGVGQASQNSTVQEIVEDSLGDVNIPPEKIQTVVTGTASRMLRGDTDGAKAYLARQTNITPAQADAKIAQARAQVDQALVQARVAASKTFQATGWSLFIMMIVGGLFASLGGMMGSRSNVKQPLVERSEAFATSGFRESYS